MDSLVGLRVEGIEAIPQRRRQLPRIGSRLEGLEHANSGGVLVGATGGELVGILGRDSTLERADAKVAGLLERGGGRAGDDFIRAVGERRPDGWQMGRIGRKLLPRLGFGRVLGEPGGEWREGVADGTGSAWGCRRARCGEGLRGVLRGRHGVAIALRAHSSGFGGLVQRSGFPHLAGHWNGKAGHVAGRLDRDTAAGQRVRRPPCRIVQRGTDGGPDKVAEVAGCGEIPRREPKRGGIHDRVENALWRGLRGLGVLGQRIRRRLPSIPVDL